MHTDRIFLGSLGRITVRRTLAMYVALVVQTAMAQARRLVCIHGINFVEIQNFLSDPLPSCSSSKTKTCFILSYVFNLEIYAQRKPAHDVITDVPGSETILEMQQHLETTVQKGAGVPAHWQLDHTPLAHLKPNKNDDEHPTSHSAEMCLISDHHQFPDKPDSHGAAEARPHGARPFHPRDNVRWAGWCGDI